MTQLKRELLAQELAKLKLAASHLELSQNRCKHLLGAAALQPEDLERLESLTSRFARLADLLVQRVFRLVDDIELVGASTVLDRIYRAEKRGWGTATDLIRIRELRNLIAHEYANEQMTDIYATVAALTPSLLSVVHQVVGSANLAGKQLGSNHRTP